MVDKVTEFSVEHVLLFVIAAFLLYYLMGSCGYRDSFSLKNIKKYKTLSDIRIIGMGGSSLGAQAIYDFLRSKIKKNFLFINNLQSKIKCQYKKSK